MWGAIDRSALFIRHIVSIPDISGFGQHPLFLCNVEVCSRSQNHGDDAFTSPLLLSCCDSVSVKTTVERERHGKAAPPTLGEKNEDDLFGTVSAILVSGTPWWTSAGDWSNGTVCNICYALRPGNTPFSNHMVPDSNDLALVGGSGHPKDCLSNKR